MEDLKGHFTLNFIEVGSRPFLIEVGSRPYFIEVGSPYFIEVGSPYFIEVGSPYFVEVGSPYFIEVGSPYFLEVGSPYFTANTSDSCSCSVISYSYNLGTYFKKTIIIYEIDKNIKIFIFVDS
jgi:hypothetical protein